MERAALVIGLFSGTVLLHAQDPWVYRDHPRWDGSWNQRSVPRAGVCFYKDVGFHGDRFCVSRGGRLGSLPGDFGDKISSLQLFGNARVAVFNDADLRTQRFRDGHTWNDRTSSMAVR
jgi:hypothetical protein